MLTDTLKENLFKKAQMAQGNSYSPYSLARVGAALLMKDGSLWSGCNIENASYGATVCAERVALWKALSEGAQAPIEAILVISSSEDPWPPCGMCRQALGEFSTKHTRVYCSNKSGTIINEYLFKDLFPLAFSTEYLEKK